MTQDDLNGFIPRTGNGNVIITTQSSKLASSYKRIAIRPLNKDNGTLLLGRLLEPRQEEPEQLSRLSDLADNLPLALEHIAGSIRSNPSITLEEYINIFTNAPPDQEAYQRIFDIALRDLKEEARKTLDCMCFLSPDTIPEHILLRLDAEFLLSDTSLQDKAEYYNPMLKVST